MGKVGIENSIEFQFVCGSSPSHKCCLNFSSFSHGPFQDHKANDKKANRIRGLQNIELGGGNCLWVVRENRLKQVPMGHNDEIVPCMDMAKSSEPHLDSYPVVRVSNEPLMRSQPFLPQALNSPSCSHDL